MFLDKELSTLFQYNKFNIRILQYIVCLYVDASKRFEDTKVVIRIRRSKKDRQHNVNRKRRKGQTFKIKTGSDIMCSGRVSRFCSISDTRRKPGDKPCMKKISGCDYDKCNNIHGHLWHKYSVTVNQIMVATVKRSST